MTPSRVHTSTDALVTLGNSIRSSSQPSDTKASAPTFDNSKNGVGTSPAARCEHDDSSTVTNTDVSPQKAAGTAVSLQCDDQVACSSKRLTRVDCNSEIIPVANHQSASAILSVEASRSFDIDHRRSSDCKLFVPVEASRSFDNNHRRSSDCEPSGKVSAILPTETPPPVTRPFDSKHRSDVSLCEFGQAKKTPPPPTTKANFKVGTRDEAIEGRVTGSPPGNATRDRGLPQLRADKPSMGKHANCEVYFRGPRVISTRLVPKKASRAFGPPSFYAYHRSRSPIGSSMVMVSKTSGFSAACITFLVGGILFVFFSLSKLVIFTF